MGSSWLHVLPSCKRAVVARLFLVHVWGFVRCNRPSRLQSFTLSPPAPADIPKTKHSSERSSVINAELVSRSATSLLAVSLKIQVPARRIARGTWTDETDSKGDVQCPRPRPCSSERLAVAVVLNFSRFELIHWERSAANGRPPVFTRTIPQRGKQRFARIATPSAE